MIEWFMGVVNEALKPRNIRGVGGEESNTVGGKHQIMNRGEDFCTQV